MNYPIIYVFNVMNLKGSKGTTNYHTLRPVSYSVLQKFYSFLYSFTRIYR